MKRTTKQRNRSKASVSKTVKKVMSLLQIEHLDYFSKVHKHDVANNRVFLGEVLGNADVAKLSDEQVCEVIKICGFEITEQSTFIPYSDLMETSEFAENLCFEGGKWTAKRGKDWLNYVTDIIEKESVYFERGYDGNHKRRERDVNPEFRETLNVIFARTPPWLASVLSEATDEKMVKKALMKVAAKFEKETGYKVHAVNIHREAGHDLHIHIMYSDVRAHRIPVSVRNRKAQVAALKKKLTAEMSEQKKTDPSISLEKSAVLAQYKKDKWDSLVNEYTDEVEYRKVLRFGATDDGEWPIEKRSMATMGTAYRYKGWIWDSAINPDDKDTICKFRDNSLINGNFTNKVAKVPHLEDRYLDWWLEQMMFRALYSDLPSDRKKLVDAGKEEAVSSYLEYGKTVVHPMQQATLKHKVAIDKQTDEDREKLAKWKSETQASLDDYEANLKNAEMEIYDDLVMSVVHEVSAGWDREEVSKSFGRLKVEKQRVAKIENDALVVLSREGDVTARESAIDSKEAKLNERESKILVDETRIEERIQVATELEDTLSNREDDLREEGRVEVLSEVVSVISPSTKQLKSKSEVLKKVREISHKAKTWDRVRPHVETLVKKVESLKKPLKWMSGIVGKIKSAMGITPESKDKDVDVEK